MSGADGPRIAYQGCPGAFSEEAALRFAPDFAPVAFPSFAEVFAAVAQGVCERACAPLRNTLAGEVAEVAARLPAAGLHVVAEHELPIALHLMAAPGAAPGAALAGVRTGESHPVALRQCARRLRSLGIAPVEAFDTAGAARAVAAAGDPTRAAVASRRAAERYGLVVLAHDIQDGEGNATRFAILSR